MPTPEETLRQLDDALGFSHGPSLSPSEAAQIQVDPTPAEQARRALDAYGTDLMRPGQDPAAYDLANPPSPPIPARIAGLAGGPLNEQMPPDAVAPRNGADYLTPVDAIGSEDRTTTRQVTAPDQPYAGPEPTTPAGDMPASPPSSVAEADRQYAQSASDIAAAQSNAAQAKLAAETYHAQQMQTALEDSAEEQQLANHAFERARQANEAKADADTASWITSMEAKAKEEPLPGRWWSNQGHLGQALWGLGLLFSSAYAAITPGARNAALDMVRQNINNDIEEQKARQGREMAVLKLKGEAMRQQQDRAANDIRDDHSMRMTRIQALEKAWMNKATIPGDQDALAAKAASQQFFQELKGKVIEDFRNEKISATQNELNRWHAEAMQAAAQNFQARQNDLNRAQEMTIANMANKRAYDLAPVSISEGGRTGPGGMPLDKEGRPLYRQPEAGIGSPSGLVMLGPDKKPLGGTGAFSVYDNEQAKTINDTVEAANVKYGLLQQLADKLDAGAIKGAHNVPVGVDDPDVASLLVQIGYGNAKEYDTRVSDPDYQNGIIRTTGLNPNGGTLDKALFQLHYDEVRKLVHKQLRDMPNYVSGRIHYDQTLVPQGSKAVWDPQMRQAPEVKEKNAAETEGRQPGVSKPILTADAYEKAARTERQDPGQRGLLLPHHDSRVVEDLISSAENRAPSTVHAVAAKLLDDLRGREEVQTRRLENPVSAKDPWGTGESDPEARAAAQRTLDSLKATEGLVRNIEADLANKQQKKLDAFKSDAAQMWQTGNPSEADLVQLAHDRYDLSDAGEAVRSIIEDVRKQPKPFKDIRPMFDVSR